MNTNYKILEHEACCGKCQFVIDRYHYFNGYTSLSCANKANANSRGLMEVQENGLCNLYAHQGDISEEEFRNQLAEQAKGIY